MGEETKNSRKAAPKAIVWSLATNGVFGVIMIVTLIVRKIDLIR